MARNLDSTPLKGSNEAAASSKDHTTGNDKGVPLVELEFPIVKGFGAHIFDWFDEVSKYRLNKLERISKEKRPQAPVEPRVEKGKGVSSGSKP